jgi:hypothetical protein
MSSMHSIPSFGRPLRSSDYYELVDGLISTLRPHSTLRAVANHLQAAGLRTPSNLDWTRMRVAQYVRNRKLETNFINKEQV